MAALALVATAYPYHRALGVWWAHDDVFNLRWVLAHRVASNTFDSATWQRLPFRTLTIRLMPSHDVDLALLGLRPLDRPGPYPWRR